MKIVQYASNSNVGTFLIFASIIFLIFRLLHFVLLKYSKTKRKQVFSKVLYLVECIFWFVVLYQGIVLFKSKNMVFSAFNFIILGIIVGWSTWFVFKDYMAGLYCKIDGTFKLNETIEFDGYIGKISRIGGRMLELELSASKIVSIPYHQFFIKRIIFTGTTGNCAKEYFVFKLNPKYETVTLLEEINTYIHQLPWTSNKYEQEVRFEKSNNQEVHISINASLFDKKYSDRFQQMIRQKFE